MDDVKIRTIADDLFSVYPLLYKNIVKTHPQCMDINISKSHYHILFILDKTGTQSVTEISKKVCISKPQMTVLIDKLISEKLIERLPDIKDRRVINISLTEKGNEYVNNYKELIISNLKNKLSSLSSEDLEALANALNTVKNITLKINMED